MVLSTKNKVQGTLFNVECETCPLSFVLLRDDYLSIRIIRTIQHGRAMCFDKTTDGTDAHRFFFVTQKERKSYLCEP